MMTKNDYERAARLYLKRPSNAVATPQAPHNHDLMVETTESRVNGAEMIHEFMDVVYESTDVAAIREATGLYVSWLKGSLSTGSVYFALEHLAWGETKPRYQVIKDGAVSLVFSPITKAEADLEETGMRFAGAILHNAVEGDINKGQSYHARWEGYGTDVHWVSSNFEFTIARLIVGAYGIDTLMHVNELNVRDAFFGLQYEETHGGKAATPWSKVGDSSIVELY